MTTAEAVHRLYHVVMDASPDEVREAWAVIASDDGDAPPLTLTEDEWERIKDALGRRLAVRTFCTIAKMKEGVQ